MSAQPQARRSSAATHLAANTLGRLWVLLANVIMFPAYLKLLGQENFGIVALLTSVTAIVALFDFGLTPVVARELNHQQRNQQSRRNLLFSAELIFMGIVGALVAVAWLLPAPVLATLVHAPTLASTDLVSALRWVFSIAALQLLFNFHVSALSGMEAQVHSSLLALGVSVVRSVGVLVPLLWMPTVEVFLTWQLGTTAVGIGLSRWALYALLQTPQASDQKARFSWHDLRANASAAGASFLLACAATLNMNLDKVFVAKIMGLARVAEYTIAATFAQLIFIAIVPITMTVTPRMVRALTGHDDLGFHRLLGLTSSSIGLVVALLAVVFFSHGPQIIEIWSVGVVKASDVAAYTPWLIAGASSLAISAIFHCVASAHKDFSFGRPYALSLFFVLPAYWWAIGHWGLQGAAMAWGSAQVLIMLSYLVWVGRRLLHGHAWQAVPVVALLVGAASAIASHWLLAPWVTNMQGLPALVALLALELTAAATMALLTLTLVSHHFKWEDPLASRLVAAARQWQNRLKAP